MCVNCKVLLLPFLKQRENLEKCFGKTDRGFKIKGRMKVANTEKQYLYTIFTIESLATDGKGLMRYKLLL